MTSSQEQSEPSTDATGLTGPTDGPGDGSAATRQPAPVPDQPEKPDPGHPGQVPATPVWLPALDVLRAFAAGAVVVHHSWSLAGYPAIPLSWLVEGFGQWGVDLFFVLSGFLLASYWWKPAAQRSVRTFALRRIFRIAPAYYVMLLILFVFFADHDLLFSQVGIRQVVANLTFTQWLTPGTASNLNVNGVLWTLTLEAMLYALIPFLALAVGRRPWVAGLSLFAAGMLYRFWAGMEGSPLVGWYFPGDGGPGAQVEHLFAVRQFAGILPVFMVGILLRWLTERGGLRRWVRTPVTRPSALMVLLLLVPSMLVLRRVAEGSDFQSLGWFVAYDAVLGLLFVPVLLYASRPVVGHVSPLFRAGQWLGTRSYSLYLWHFPIVLSVYGMGPMERAAITTHWPVRLLLIAVLSVLAAHVSYELVEKPGMKRGQDLTRRKRSVDPAT